MKRVDAAEPAALAVLGEVDAGEDADRRADQRRQRRPSISEPKIALARPPVSACGGGVISVKSVERQRRRCPRRTSRQDPDQPEQAERHRGERQRQRDRVDALAPACSVGARCGVGIAAHRRSCACPSRFVSCSSSSFESASTMKVIRNRIRPSSISDAWCRPGAGLVELVGERRGDAVARARTATAS